MENTQRQRATTINIDGVIYVKKIEPKSKRVQLVIQPSLHERAKAKAKAMAMGISVNEYICTLIARDVAGI